MFMFNNGNMKYIWEMVMEPVLWCTKNFVTIQKLTICNFKVTTKVQSTNSEQNIALYKFCLTLKNMYQQRSSSFGIKLLKWITETYLQPCQTFFLKIFSFHNSVLTKKRGEKKTAKKGEKRSGKRKKQTYLTYFTVNVF